ncbi:hypothetical protein B11476_02220 [Campylobacter coli]|nr:hypothetical protein B11476_02220 [Campylobacter coli]
MIIFIKFCLSSGFLYDSFAKSNKYFIFKLKYMKIYYKDLKIIFLFIQVFINMIYKLCYQKNKLK